MASEQPPAKLRRINTNITNNCGYKFELEHKIGNEDFLSNLPEDCLLEIFPLFDHVDLNSLFAVNQKMHRFATQARPKARKGVIEQMNIVKIDNNEYTLTIIFNQNTVISDTIHSGKIVHENCEFCNDISKKVQPTAPLSVIHNVFQRMWRLPRRYDFNSVKFDTMFFDLTYFAVCKYLFRVKSKRLIFSNTDMEPSILYNLDFNPSWLYGYDRGYAFHHWMIDGCLEELQLSSKNLHNFYLYELLKLLAKTVSAPSIRIESTRIPKQIQSFGSSYLHNRLDQFVNCINFHVEYLVFAANSFMRAIIQRSQKGRAGLWQILISNGITINFINDALPQGMTVSPTMADGYFEVIGSNGESKMTIKQLNEYIYPDSSNKLFSVSVIFHV